MTNPSDQPTAPSKAQITRFIEVFTQLNNYEALMFESRLWGAFDRATTPMPDPAVVAVLSWLKEQMA